MGHRLALSELDEEKGRREAQRLVFSAVIAALGQMPNGIMAAPEQSIVLAADAQLQDSERRHSGAREVDWPDASDVVPRASSISDAPQRRNSQLSLLDDSECLLEPRGWSRVSHESLESSRVDGERDDECRMSERTRSRSSPELSRLRHWLDESAGRNAFAGRMRADTRDTAVSAKSGSSFWHAPVSGVSNPPKSGTKEEGPPTELMELLAGFEAHRSNLSPDSTLIAGNAPIEIRRMVEDFKRTLPWDPSDLQPAELARILREGVAVGAVDPQRLACFLGETQSSATRESFFCAMGQRLAWTLSRCTQPRRACFRACAANRKGGILRARTSAEVLASMWASVC